MKFRLIKKSENQQKTANHFRAGFKRAVSAITLFSLVFSLVMPAVLYPLPSYGAYTGPDPFKAAFDKAAMEVAIIVPGVPSADIGQRQQNVTLWEKAQEIMMRIIMGFSQEEAGDEGRDKFKWAQLSEWQTYQDAGFIALQQGLQQIMNTLAYDVSTWLGSGGEGEQPMFITQGWGAYLRDAGDQAAGTMIESLNDGLLPFNLCEPNIEFKLSIGLGLKQHERPDPPDCSLTDYINNWDDFIHDDDFLEKFLPSFDPHKYDIGIAGILFDKKEEVKLNEEKAKQLEREEGRSFGAITEKIGGGIMTPSPLTHDEAKEAIAGGKAGEQSKVVFGSIFGSTVTIFADTLLSTFLDTWFKKGIAALMGDDESSGSAVARQGENPLDRAAGFIDGFLDDELYEGETGELAFSGAKAAESRFMDFLGAGRTEKLAYDFLSQLTLCLDPANPGPFECAVLPDFRQAISQEITLEQAINDGLINGDAPFGFMDWDAEAIYRGYPYRSIVILRTLRVVPAGWEIAARLINREDFKTDVHTLNELIDEYDKENSIFRGLIDKTWVIKLPQHFCRSEGYGEKILFSDLSGGADGGLAISRDTYCADYQSCIQEDQDGSCQYYGYCVEDKRIWDLRGTKCPDYYNTCLTFQDRSGRVASYLENTLDYNSCSIDNVGCQWLCQEYNPVDNLWTCTNRDERVLKPCNQELGCYLSAQCSLAEGDTLCFDPNSAVSLEVANPCSPGSNLWNETKNQCEVAAGCTVARGGVLCRQTGCESLPNSLPNPGFETSVGMPGPGLSDDDLREIAKNWRTNKEGTEYFELVSGDIEKIYSGKNSLRFFSYGGPVDVVVSSTALADLPASEAGYTFSSYIYNRLNSGNITIEIRDSESDEFIADKEIIPTIQGEWQFLSFDFSLAGSVKPVVSIIVKNSGGGPVSGTAWFDDFKITDKCTRNPITLALVGTIDRDGSKLHLDRDAQPCSAADDGCSEFIRLKENLGTNIVSNSSFESWPLEPSQRGWTAGGDGEVRQNSADVSVGSYSLALDADVELASQSLFAAKPATEYRLSFYAKAAAADAEVSIDGLAEFSWERAADLPGQINFERYGDSAIVLTDSWRRFVMDATTTPIDSFNFILSFNNSSEEEIYIDGVQLEAIGYRGTYSNYKDYGTDNLVYLKKPPASLGCSGDIDSDPAECNNYALYCSQEEVGCELYTPVSGGLAIPGVVALADYCPAECVGYDAYKQSKTYFENYEALEYFIPSRAVQCTASQQGCDEFTNLDEVAQGGEGREYYQYMRLCEKPEQADCRNFYTWQGSDENGYQLKAYYLSAAASGAPQEVIPYAGEEVNWPEYWCADKLDRNNDDQPDCCDGPEDIANNPFCKEFYSASGEIHYFIYNNTLTCSADCHPYRKTRLTDNDEEERINCAFSNPAYVHDENNSSYSDDGDSAGWQNNACIYHAIPGQGVACSAAAVGCREYRGNAGGNIYLAFKDNFEDGEESGWGYGGINSEAVNITGHSIKSESGLVQTDYGTLLNSSGDTINCSDSLTLCDKDNPADFNCYDRVLRRCVAESQRTHETYLININQQRNGLIANLIKPDKTYILSFWAKSGSGVLADLEFGLKSDSGQPVGQPATVINIGPDWKYYTFGPFIYNDIPLDSVLYFQAGAGKEFYLDNIELKQVQNYVYVIKNSWNIPDSCDINPWLASGPIAAPKFMLGCRQYADSYGRIHNLKSFNSLCREEAVGCEALVDTYNSSSPFAEIYNVGDSTFEVIGSEPPVFGDFARTVPADQLVYLVNRRQNQCDSIYKGCQGVGFPQINIDNEVAGYQTLYLINDPDKYDTILCRHSEVGCEEFQTGSGYAYFKQPGVLTCEYRNSPSGSGYAWFKTGSTSEYRDCPIARTFFGVERPSAGFVGLCPARYNTCTQFIDPPSPTSKNIVFNPAFRSDVNIDHIPDGWEEDPDDPNLNPILLKQKISLQRDTLYTLSVVFKSADGSFSNITGADGIGEELFIGLNSDCVGLTSFDHSTEMATSTVWGLLPSGYAQDSRPLNTLERQYSGRFFSPESQSCDFYIYLEGGSSSSDFYNDIKDKIKEVGLRETDIYYNLADSIDRASCNGIVDNRNGCVLFNDRSYVNYSIGEDDNSYLVFDSDVSGIEKSRGVAISDCTGCTGSCDSNVILKVRPDRTCGTWLACSSSVVDVNEDGIEERSCFDLGLCNRINEDGTCQRWVEQAVPHPGEDERRFYYTAPEEIANLSGYSNVGLRVSDDFILPGYFNYAEAEEWGNSTGISNGNFESLLSSESLQPIGWSTVDTDGFGNGSQFKGWLSSKFSSGTNVDIPPPEGVRYLSLHSFYEARSEEIDVEPGDNVEPVEYILSCWVNTLDLTMPGAKAQLEIEGAASRMIEVEAGSPWVHKTLKFTPDGDGKTVRIVLKNIWEDENGNEDPDCTDYDPDTACDLTGDSWWDDIVIKPVLEIQPNVCLDSSGIPAMACTTPPDYLCGCSLDSQCDSGICNSDNFLTRTCRLYPAGDAHSCKYFDDNHLYYGQYGYCMTADPQDPSQCLQWLPIDQLSGETLDEVSGYQDRFPLYYCTNEKTVNIDPSDSGALVSVGGKAESAVGNFSELANKMIASDISFNVSENYRIFFRYPYIQKFTFEGSGFAFQVPGIEVGEGSTAGGVYFIIPFTVGMEKDRISFKLFGEGFSNFIELFEFEVPPVLQDKIDEIFGLINTYLTPLIGIGPLDVPVLGDPGAITLGIQPEEEWGGFGILPVVFYLGDSGIAIVVPIPLPWSIATNPTIQSAIVALGNSITGGGSGVDVGSVMSLKIVTDQDSNADEFGTDPYPDLDGDILGVSWFMDMRAARYDVAVIGGTITGDFNVNYCQEVTKVVTDAGINKAWASRVSEGSGYISHDSVVIPRPNTDTTGDTLNPIEVDYLYYEPFDYLKYLEKVDELDRDIDNILEVEYLTSDYKPFGAAVQPAGLPDSWNSREQSLYRQPLFREPPLLSLPEPYQVRMGEAHSVDSLKRLFAKSYGVYKWQWYDEDPDHGGNYFELPDSPDKWDLPTGTCSSLDGRRPAEDLNTNADFCLFTPVIDHEKLDDSGNWVIVHKNRPVKLTFNASVDKDQAPITGYSINWGDGNYMSVSGVSLRNRAHPDYPFKIFHDYDYWRIQKYATVYGGRICYDIGEENVDNACVVYVRDNSGAVCRNTEGEEADAAEASYCILPNDDIIDCRSDYCIAKIEIEIRDNWEAEKIKKDVLEVVLFPE